MKNLYTIDDGVRFYNIYSVNEIDLFSSELSIFCNTWVKNNNNLFYIKCLPKNDLILTQKELDYIYLLDQNCKNFEYLDINKRVSHLMNNQKNDLLLLLGLENINFFFIIPRFNKKNIFYFDFFISMRDESRYNDLLNLNFNSILIDYVEKIKNLSFLDIKTIFNFNSSKFSINKFDYRSINILNIDHEKKKINIQPMDDEEVENNMIAFFKNCEKDKNLEVMKDWRSEIKETLSNYLEKPNINDDFKKISYFFYWNINIPIDIESGYLFILDDETGYSVIYSHRISILCHEFNLNSFIV